MEQLPLIEFKDFAVPVAIFLIVFLASYFIIRKGEPVDEDDDTTSFYN